MQVDTVLYTPLDVTETFPLIRGMYRCSKMSDIFQKCQDRENFRNTKIYYHLCLIEICYNQITISQISLFRYMNTTYKLQNLMTINMRSLIPEENSIPS